MKKILFAILIFLIAFLIKFPTPLKAACVEKDIESCTNVRCNLPNSSVWLCCDTDNECMELYGYTTPDCEEGGEINTAIGCIPVKTTGDFMGWILGWAVGVGGGIAFLLIIYASFMVMTSQNNPERLKAGQELLTSAISGLILLIFSVFILRFIGVDILKLDSFGFGK